MGELRLVVARRAHSVLMSAALASGVTFASFAVHANCAMPASYNLKVVGNTVTICPSNLNGRECPDSAGMLRQGPDATVLLPDKCSESAYGTSCYVDECVEPGTYKYGFARPYECCSYCCDTDYYASVSVLANPGAGCAPDGGASVPFAGTVPWTDSRLICTYMGTGAAGGRGGTGAGGVGGDAGAAGNAGVAGDEGVPPSSNGACDCAVGVGSGAKELVIAANALLVLMGLALGRRRQSRRP